MVRVLRQTNVIVRVGFDALIIAMLLLAIYQQVQLREEVSARQDAAYSNCQAANESRHVIVNIMLAAENLAAHSVTMSKQQKFDATNFYDSQIKRIMFSDCSAYR